LVIVGITPVIDWPALLILNVIVPVPLPPAFVADTVTLAFPAAVGVPLMTPEVVFNVKPDGNVPLAYPVGAFVALILALNTLPTVPLIVVDVTTGAAAVTVKTCVTFVAAL
jgi:hypothetical protein